ncbi:hypothetical protein CDD81_541 [Ophiocordyceps australis]|uniref:Extracellular membrane protein CFEM domain-containing protein n=1 Tax=Ophiocordyceps australis TaxID=1399860 RepID=A0A2C5YE86_9HYPO|nr:hypothetical protein CDD81_541 [Ophiocordyceps australis]
MKFLALNFAAIASMALAGPLVSRQLPADLIPGRDKLCDQLGKRPGHSLFLARDECNNAAIECFQSGQGATVDDMGDCLAQRVSEQGSSGPVEAEKNDAFLARLQGKAAQPGSA